MALVLNGTTGASMVQDNTITSAKIVNASVSPDDMKYKCAFKAYPSSTVVYSTQSYIAFGQEQYDVGNNYNTSTSLFTAPVSGIYGFNIIIANGSVSQTISLIVLAVNGVSNRARDVFENRSQTSLNDEVSALRTLSLNAGDTVGVVNWIGTTSIEGVSGNPSYYSAFEGFLICGTGA